MTNYRVFNYDLWGNDEDGYNVNQMFDTGITIEIDSKASFDEQDKTIACVLGLDLNDVHIDNVDDDALYIQDCDGKPLYELIPTRSN